MPNVVFNERPTQGTGRYLCGQPQAGCCCGTRETGAILQPECAKADGIPLVRHKGDCIRKGRREKLVEERRDLRGEGIWHFILFNNARKRG